jgi:hypothetical protein
MKKPTVFHLSSRQKNDIVLAKPTTIPVSTAIKQVIKKQAVTIRALSNV